MASNTAASSTLTDEAAVRDADAIDEWSTRRNVTENPLATLVRPLASLKLTVALFAMSIFLILAGTLAQVEMDIWQVIDEYFRTFFAWIELQVFFPPSFFPSKPQIPGGFYFPGGWLIGGLMGLNLVAAHAVRFKVQARGSRLGYGLLVIVGGIVTTWLVIASGSNTEGIQDTSLIGWSELWILFEIGLGVLWLGAAKALWSLPSQQTALRVGLLAVLVIVGGLLGWLLSLGEAAQLGDSSMRILWQLTKGTVAGLVLLAGCMMVFKKRAGIVLLHGGIGLMMFNELWVGLTAVEGQMHIMEGETTNYVMDIRSLELAIVDESAPETDDVVVVPEKVLLAGERIQNDQLPFDVQLVDFMKNSNLRDAKADDENPATVGAGLNNVAEPAKPSAGTDTGGGVDMASAYVTFADKDGADLGTYLVSAFLKPQPVTVGEKTYNVELRFKRNYKPYSLHLVDVRKDDYLGTNTPRNYSSDVRIVDPTRNVDRTTKIWMNNPLRFAGETFYQSGYNRLPGSGIETTTLQVVSNTGWMIPYVSCMIVAVGMLAQFGMVLLRFLNRRSLTQAQAAKLKFAGTVSTAAEATARSKRKEKRRLRDQESLSRNNSWSAVTIVPLVTVIFFAAYIGSKARPAKIPLDAMQVTEFGKLPLVFEGRAKPFDTLARTSLRVISNREEYTDDADKKQPAIRWLLDLISQSEQAGKHKIFRIENLEVLNLLGLQPRDGFRYAVDEFRPKAPEFNKAVDRIRTKGTDNLDVFDRKIMELDGRIRRYTLLEASFRPMAFPPLPTEAEFTQDREKTEQRLQGLVMMFQDIRRADQMLENMQPPLAVPVAGEDRWQAHSVAWTDAFEAQEIKRGEANPATLAMTRMLTAYAAENVSVFNRELAQYQAMLKADPRADVNLSKVDFEAFFNQFAPFYYSMVLYVAAFILASLAWLGWNKPLNRASLWLIIFTLGIHTFALIARIYISGRPPVTNLYSSAVFIGWGCVALGIVLELLYKLGIGNVMAAIAGYSTLQIAHFLAGDGDTFVVLQAVLDTQFWLATHVVCITFGYATTFVAGLLGIIYIIRGVLTRSLSPEVGKDLVRMIYGTLCFAIFFSFVGTVLGGLWADDSWGRFWGWDPKENGALIIVIWNALVLHARWGGMVKDRGLAVLAVVGNIATSWSWFGVNELGIGLHSYGFREGTLMALGMFILSQLVVIGMGLIPKEGWMSVRAPKSGGGQSFF